MYSLIIICYVIIEEPDRSKHIMILSHIHVYMISIKSNIQILYYLLLFKPKCVLY